MLCKVETKSVTFLKIAFYHFSVYSGLEENQDKLYLVVTRVGDAATDELPRIICFQLGTLPFKYLGMAIKPQRLNNQDWEALVDNHS